MPIDFKPLVPHTPTIELDFDKYGHCAFCHRFLLIEKIIDGRVELVNHPDFSDEEFLINDGSRIRINICHKCKPGFGKKDYKKLMASVIKGWATEVQYLSHWTDEQRSKYIKRYSKKEIIMKSTNVHPEHTDKAFKEYKNKVK